MPQNFRILLVLTLCVLSVACGPKSQSDQEHVANAEAHFSKGEIRTASIELKNALAKNSENAQARKLLGQINLMQGDMAAAGKELQKYQTLQTEDNSVNAMLARVYLHQNNINKLLDLSGHSLPTVDKADLLVSQALGALRQPERREQAGQWLENALTLDPTSEYALLSQAKFHTLNRDFYEAKERLSGLLDQNPKNATAWAMLGDIEWENSNLPAATIAINNAIKHDPNSLAFKVKRLNVLLDKDDVETVQTEITTLLHAHSGNSDLHLIQGLLHLKRSNLSEAQSSFEQAMNSARVNAEAVYYLGLTHFQRGNAAQAENYIKQYSSANPESLVAKQLLSKIKIDTKRYQQAEELLKPLVLSDTGDSFSAQLLASALFNQDKLDEAIDFLGSSLPGNTGLQAYSMISSPAAAVEKPFYLTTNAINEHIKAQRYDEALRLGNELSNSNPGMATPHSLLANIHTLMGNTSSAVLELRKALAIAPGNLTANYRLAEILLKQKQYNATRQLLNELLRHQIDHLPTMMAIIKLDILENKTDAMLRHLDEAAIAHPGALEPGLTRARYLLSKKDNRAALEALSAIDLKHNSDPALLYTLALTQLNLPDYVKAMKTLEKLIGVQPKVGQWHFLKASALHALGDTSGTNAALQQAAVLSPAFVPARISLARLAVKDKNVQALSSHIETLSNIAPELDELATLKLSLSELRMAEPEAPSATTANFNNILDRAKNYWSSGDQEHAIEIIQVWVEDNPDDLKARLVLASSLDRASSSAKAIAQYEKVLQQQAFNPVALNNLAWLLQDKAPAESLEYAKQAVAAAPGSASTHDTLAVIYHKNKNNVDAWRTIKRARELDPSDPSIAFHSAMIASAIGQKKLATQTLYELLNKNTQFPERAAAESLLSSLKQTTN